MSIQRCYAVILFTDLCSSTSLCEKIDAEFYAEIIAQIRKIAEHAIGRNKGLLNQFHGDGILAAFGFPKPAEDAIHNATTAALELHREVRNAQRHYKLPKNFQLKMHSGIDAGYIVADTGDRIQGQYKFAGNALNTAARLSDLAEQDEIIVSVDTLRHELPFFVTERLNNVKLKGKQKCISVYKIKGSSKIKNRFQAREHMGLTPFMGRPKELRRLADALLSSKNGRLNHINIIGDAGLGKSRLVKHFLSLNHCSNCNIYQTFCVENRPFFSIYQLLSDIFSIEAGTPAKDIRHNIVTKLKRLNLNSAAACKQLVKMHSLDFESDMENRDLRCFITKHLASILGVLAEEKPIIVLIDDCHLGDRQLFQNLALLFQQLQKSRILIITCNRPGIKSKLPSMGETLLLSPLKAAKGKNLIHRLLPQNCSEKTTHAVFAFCGGNPLYIEETCKAILQNLPKNPKFDIEPKDKFEKPINLYVPPKIVWLIMQRLQGLPVKLKKTIQCAAIIGRRINTNLLEILCDHKLSGADLQSLKASRLIYSAQKNSNILIFNADITRIAIYETIHISKKNYLREKYQSILDTLQSEAAQPSTPKSTTQHLLPGGKERIPPASDRDRQGRW